MEPERDDRGENLVEETGEQYTEGDGCGFRALFRPKHQKNSTNNTEVEPAVQRDGTTMATMTTTGSRSSSKDDQPSEESTAEPQIPEYVFYLS